MFEDKHANMLGNMIAVQATREATKQAQAEVDALEVLIDKELESLGINVSLMHPAYALIAAVREQRINNLVRIRLQAVADALLAPAKVSTQEIKFTLDTAKLQASIEQITRNTKRLADNIENVTEGGNAMRTESVIGASTAFDIATPAPGTPAYNAHNAIRTQA